MEGKGFDGPSELTEFEKALGQYNIYFLAIKEKEPDRTLFLAVPDDFYQDFMEDPFFQKIIQLYSLRILSKNDSITCSIMLVLFPSKKLKK